MSGAPIEQAAVNAGNFTIPDGVNFVRLTIAAGSLTTFTLKMPANPVDGQYIVWTVEKLIASLTLQANAGQTIVGVTAPGPGANQFGLLWYRLAATQWVSPGTAI
jgi:hypothetical protein